MKKIIIILSIITALSCKAQMITPLAYPVDLDQPIAISRYYKDTDNDFNPYIGTWSGTLGNGTLTITFNKVIHNDDDDGNFSDVLVGEYRYVENGTVLVDTYPQLISTDPNGVPIVAKPNALDNNISSIVITDVNRGFPPCTECAPNTRFIFLHIAEPNKPGLWGQIRMARFVQGNIEKLRMRINNSFDETATQGYDLSIPENSIWTLIKEE